MIGTRWWWCHGGSERGWVWERAQGYGLVDMARAAEAAHAVGACIVIVLTLSRGVSEGRQPRVVLDVSVIEASNSVKT